MNLDTAHFRPTRSRSAALGRHAAVIGTVAAQGPGFEYRLCGTTDWILVHEVPDEASAVYSIDGGPPTLLPRHRCIELPRNLSGRVTVAVRWSVRGVVVRSGHQTSVVDLDAARHLANASA